MAVEKWDGWEGKKSLNFLFHLRQNTLLISLPISAFRSNFDQTFNEGWILGISDLHEKTEKLLFIIANIIASSGISMLGVKIGSKRDKTGNNSPRVFT